MDNAVNNAIPAAKKVISLVFMRKTLSLILVIVWIGQQYYRLHVGRDDAMNVHAARKQIYPRSTREQIIIVESNISVPDVHLLQLRFQELRRYG